MSGMTKCKACGKEIAKGVNKCVGCGKDQRNFFMRHKILTGIIVVAVIGIIGSSGNNTPTKVADTNTTKSVSSTAKETTPKSTIFKIGDTVKLSDYKVKINKASVIKSGNEFQKPTDGKEYFAVDCTIENTSSTEQTISSIMMFKVVDKDGRACDMAIVTGKGQLDGTIGVGRKMTGQYTVEAPKGATGLELEFDGSLFSSGQIVVKLN